MTQDQEKKQSTETDPGMTPMLELADKDFKAVIIFSKTTEKIVIASEEIEEFQEKNKIYFKRTKMKF